MAAKLEHFAYYLEGNLYALHSELNYGKYKHQGYRKFVATDNKRREVSVATIKDRVVHRLLYGYLVDLYDETFIFDLWSCRKEKGLVGAIERTQALLAKYPRHYVWRSDIKKFFDRVDQQRLLEIISLKVVDPKAIHLCREITGTYSVRNRERERERDVTSAKRHSHWEFN